MFTNTEKISAVTFFAVMAAALALLMALLLPVINEQACKNRVYDDLEAVLSDDVLSANINIVDFRTTVESDNVTSYSYGTGACGVIFRRDGDTYYALTAAHVVNKGEGVEYIVIPYGAETLAEYREENGLSGYYEQFGKAEVVSVSEKYDLAVISFSSSELLGTLDLARSAPAYGEKICSIGNRQGEKHSVTYGKITSKAPRGFKTDDGLPTVSTLRHNAYIAKGCSGGAVLDAEMKIAGINIGGGTGLTGRFRYGAMVPCGDIADFLLEAGL